MENFFNWMSKPVPLDEVEVWFNMHNMSYEKIELFGDFFKSLYKIMSNTYLGNDDVETKIELTKTDNENHFEWCWNKVISDFRKENIVILKEGKHKDYFKNFFLDTFYEPKEKNLKTAIPNFIEDVFDTNTVFSKSDLEILTEIYSLIEKNFE